MPTTTPARGLEVVSVWSAGHELLDGRRYVTTHLNQGRKALTTRKALSYAAGLLSQVNSAAAASRYRGDELAEPGWPTDRYDVALEAVRSITAIPVDEVDADVLAAAKDLGAALVKAGAR